MEAKTLTITNFGGPLTRRGDGDINSGFAKQESSWGYDPFSKPGNLTWMEKPSSILTLTGSTGPILTQELLADSAGQSLVYSVDNAGNFYKTLANNNQANQDKPSVLGAFTGSHTFLRGVGFEIYGSSNPFFLGSDAKIERIDNDGANASVIALGLATAPRPFAKFVGKLYFGNKNNIGEIDSTKVVTTITKLSPALPDNLYINDLSVTPDGNYLQITAIDNQSASDLVGTSGNVGLGSGGDAYRFYWDGIAGTYSAFETYSGIVTTSGISFSDKKYLFGNDSGGLALLSGTEKVLSIPASRPPVAGATFSLGNLLGFGILKRNNQTGSFDIGFYVYGQYDNETANGLFCLLQDGAKIRSSILSVSTFKNVSNEVRTSPAAGNADNAVSYGKVYYSTVEGDNLIQSSLIQKLWKFNTIPTGIGSVVTGVYETQNQIFSKKEKVGEVRLYTEPLVANNSFSLGIVNSANSVIASNTYTVGTNVTAGDEVVRWTPPIAPVYTLGLKITNLGSKNWTGLKAEVDTSSGGT